MGWRDRYRSLCTSPESAVKLLSPRERIYLGGNAATPDLLTAATPCIRAAPTTSPATSPKSPKSSALARTPSIPQC